MSWIHLHLALNHVPVLGSAFVTLLMMIGVVRKSDELTKLSLVLFVVLSVISIPIKFTGDFAYEETADAEWMEEPRATAHEQSADQATTGVFLLGVAAATGLFAGRNRTMPKWVIPVTMILGILTFALMARSAFLGGQLRHTEIRDSACTPVSPLVDV